MGPKAGWMLKTNNEDVMDIGRKGTKSLRKEIGSYSVYDLMALSYLLGALGVLGAQNGTT